MFALWISVSQRLSAGQRAFGLLTLVVLGLKRNLEGRETEQWLTPAWGEKQLSSANLGPGLFPLTDLISTLLVLLQLLCMQGRQFPWFGWDMENRSHGNMPHQEEWNRWFLWKALRAVTRAVSDFNYGHELPDLTLSSQRVPHLIHYLPPNLLPFCDSHLSQWLTIVQLFRLQAWVLSDSQVSPLQLVIKHRRSCLRLSFESTAFCLLLPWASLSSSFPKVTPLPNFIAHLSKINTRDCHSPV